MGGCLQAARGVAGRSKKAVPNNALSNAGAAAALKAYLWARCPPSIKAMGVREWRKSLRPA